MDILNRGIDRRSFIKKTSLTFTAFFLQQIFHPVFAKEIKRKMKGNKVVIIGSGITGLCSGAILAKQGFDVTVLEANPTFIGGHARSYVFDDLMFCTGPQYVWNFNNGEIGSQVLHYLGIEEDVKFVKMDPFAFENYLFGNSSPISIPMGLTEFEKIAIEQYPQFNDGIKQFFAIIDDLHTASKKLERKGLYLSDESSMVWSIIFDLNMSLRIKKNMLKFSKSSLAELYDHCGLTGNIRRFLYGNSGIFAENVDQISAVLFAAATGSYHAGAFVPEQGFRSLVEALSNAIKRCNGTIICGKVATEIVLNGKEASAVYCKDGSKYPCDVVLSNLSPKLTCNLLGHCQVTQYTYKPSNSLVSCFLVIRDAEHIKQLLRLKNFWWYDADHEVNYNEPDMYLSPRMLYIGSPSANSTQNERGKNKESLVVFAPGNFDQAKLAKEQNSEVYHDLLNVFTENVIKILDEKIFPGLREKIVQVHIETPWEIHVQAGAEDGNVYGRRLTAESILANDLGEISKIDNLYVGCATVGLPGIATCFRTASILCKEITGKDITI